MERNRSYNHGCLLAKALDQVGDRWAMLIVRELLAGPQRFSDLRAGLSGLSPNVLAQRLVELQADGIVEKRQLPAPAGTAAYALTARGRGLRPALEALVRWSWQEARSGGEGPTSVASLLLLIEAGFGMSRAKQQAPLFVRLTLGETDVAVEVRDGCLALSRPAANEPGDGRVTLYGAPARIADLVLGRRTLAHALSAGEVRIEGDASEVQRFLDLFGDGDVGPGGIKRAPATRASAKP